MKTIFVSSTFKDMHFERDAIQENVLPAVNAQARRYGQSVSFCDLRWGISTEELESEEGSRKVLEVCLDEIDRCKPPMVVILGDRYGWIPSDGLIADAAAYKKLQLDHLKKSVTALEIEYGALRGEKTPDRTLFYFREITNDPPAGYGTEDAEHAALLSELKERIYGLTDGKIRTYRVSWDEKSGQFSGMNSFSKMLSEDLLQMLRPEWEAVKSLTPHERERRTHLNFVEEKGKGFSARQVACAQYLQKIREGEKCTIIKGEPGTGKSTLLSHLALVLAKEGYETLPLISGLTLKSSTAMDLIRQIVYEMENRLHLPHFQEEAGAEDRDTPEPDEKEWKKRYDELCPEYAAAGRRLVILLDAADQLLADQAREKLLFIPDELSPQVQFVMTCLTDFPTGGYSCSLLGPVDDQEKQLIIEGILKSHGRELSSGVKEAILRKKSSDYPLYLSMLIQRLIMMNRQDFDRILQAGDGMDAITARQKKIVEECPDSVEALSVELIRVAGERIGGAFAQTAAQYIAASRYGLRTDDLSGLLGSQFRMLDFAHLVSYMNESFLLREDGRYDFAHKSIRAGFLEQCGDPKMLHWKLKEYFDTLPDGDEVKDREFTYHCIMAGDGARFAECVIGYQSRWGKLRKQPGEEAALEKKKMAGLLSFAGMNLYTTSLADQGAFLFSLTDGMESREESLHFVWFIEDDYEGCFENSAADSDLLRLVREHVLSLAERICRDSGESVFARRMLVAACESLSYSYRDNDKKPGPRSALRERAVSIARELLTENPSDLVGKRRLAKALQLAGEAGHDLGEEADKKALMQFEEAMRLRREVLRETGSAFDKRLLAEICDDLAEMHRGKFMVEAENEEADSIKQQILRAKEKDRKAFALYEEALSLRREALQEDPTEYGRKQLAYGYDLTAEWYLGSGIPESAGKSMKLYEEEITLWREQAACHKTAGDYISLATACRKAGELYVYMQTADGLERAAALCEEAVIFGRQAAGMLGTPAAGWQSARCQLTLADVYIQCGGSERMERAEELLREGMAVLEELVDTEHGEKSDLLAKAYRLQGHLLLKKDDGTDKAEAEVWNRRSAGIAKIPEYLSYSSAEMLEIFEYLEDEVRPMIPIRIAQFIRDNASATYQKHLDPEIPLDEQVLSGYTETMLELLFSRYMATDDELTDLSDIIAKNDAE